MQIHETTDLLFIDITLIRFKGEDCYTSFQNKNYQLFETGTGKFVYDLSTKKIYQLNPIDWFDMLMKIEVTQHRSKDKKPPMNWAPLPIFKM